MKTKFLLISILVLVLIVAGYFLIPRFFKSTKTVEKSVVILPIENSIAVLPFLNDSPSDSNQYFINGIMEETIRDLAGVEDLKVLSRTSVEPYRNSKKSIPEIGKELQVNYILEGSGQKIGDTFRLIVQLIKVIDGAHLWSNTYEYDIKEPTDLMTIQSQIAKDIENRIKEIITP